jgi:hypothetical protein
MLNAVDLTFVYFTQINLIHFTPNNRFNIKCAITIILEINYKGSHMEINLSFVISVRLDSLIF